MKIRNQNLSKEKINLINQHSKPLTRRDFISLGLVAGTGTLMINPLLSLVSRAGIAYGQTPTEEPLRNGQSTEKKARDIPFLAFDLAGGAGLPGNFLVGNKGGPLDLLTSYDTLGWNPKVDGWDNRYGLPMAKGTGPVLISKILEGMNQTISAEAQAKFRMASFLSVSRDDTSDNQYSIGKLVTSIQERSRDFSSLLETDKSSFGGNSKSIPFSDKDAIKFSGRFQTVRLNSMQDLIAALRPPAHIPKGNFLDNLADLTQNISKQQLQRAAAQNPTESYDNLKKASRLGDRMDSRYLPLVRNLYGFQQDVPDSTEAVLRSTIVNSVIQGISGPGIISIGGCDYHQGQAPGDTKDLEIGREIGLAIQLAHLSKVPLFIHVYTDGGVSARNGTRNWDSDSGDRSMSVIGFYDPEKTPKYRSESSMQKGAYQNGQGVDRSTLIGNSTTLASAAVFANYVALSGISLGVIENTFGGLNPATLDSFMVFDA